MSYRQNQSTALPSTIPACMCDLDDLSKWARDGVKLHRRAKALGWDDVADAFLAAAGEAIKARTALLRRHDCPVRTGL